MSEAYLYGINPRRPIKNLNDDVKIIRINKSLYLTKEEVLKCLPLASVWRRFSVDHMVKVTPDSLDRLHNEKFYTEAEWEKVAKNKLGENRGKVVVEETKPIEEKVTDNVAAAEEHPAGETEESTPDITIEQAPSETMESENVANVAENNDETEKEPIDIISEQTIPQNVNATNEDPDVNSSDDDSENSVNESSNIDVNSYNGKKKKHKH